MKKLLIIIGLVCLGVTAYSQVDSLELTDQDVLNEIPALSYMMHFTSDGSTVSLVQGQNIQPLFRSGQNFYFRNNLNDLIIGTTPSTETNTKLWVQGTGHFTDQLTVDAKFNIEESSLYQSSNELYFYDPTNGAVSLSDLNSATRSSSAANGITTYGDAFILGGYMTRNTTTDLAGYYWQIGEDDDYIQIDESGGTARLNASNRLTLYAEDITLQAVNGFRLYSDGLNAITWYDYTTTPYGLTMPDWATYWSNIESDDEEGALITLGMMEEYVSENGGGGVSGDGTGSNDTTCLDGATTAYMRLYNDTDLDTFKIVAVTVDTLRDDLFLATVNVPSSDILAGTDVIVASSAGAGYALMPIKMSVHYDYETAAYTSDDATYSAVLRYATSGDQTGFYITDDVIEGTEDKIYFMTQDAYYVYTASDALNNSIEIDFYTHTGSGTGDATIKLWYTIADFN